MENTAKNFALQLGSIISLYVSLTGIITLLFGIVTILYPDLSQNAWEYESATTSIRTALAIVVVFFPTYIVLTRIVNKTRRAEKGTYLVLTKWLLYISLLIGGAILLGDLVAVIMSFLNGELTTRFILKALSLFILVALAFAYYLADARGYWQTHEKQSIQYAAITSILVLIVLIYGFTKIENPREVREMNVDRTQIQDLQYIQNQIQSYVFTHNALPETLEDAFDRLDPPHAPTERAEYKYIKKGDTEFELCAGFFSATRIGEIRREVSPLYAEPLVLKNGNDWTHGTGNWCFERSVAFENAVRLETLK